MHGPGRRHGRRNALRKHLRRHQRRHSGAGNALSRITRQTQEYIRRFRACFTDRDCADLLKRKDLVPSVQARALGVADHCGILIVSAVEILCDYIAELKGE